MVKACKFSNAIFHLQLNSKTWTFPNLLFNLLICCTLLVLLSFNRVQLWISWLFCLTVTRKNPKSSFASYLLAFLNGAMKYRLIIMRSSYFSHISHNLTMVFSNCPYIYLQTFTRIHPVCQLMNWQNNLCKKLRNRSQKE